SATTASSARQRSSAGGTAASTPPASAASTPPAAAATRTSPGTRSRPTGVASASTPTTSPTSSATNPSAPRSTPTSTPTSRTSPARCGDSNPPCSEMQARQEIDTLRRSWLTKVGTQRGVTKSEWPELIDRLSGSEVDAKKAVLAMTDPELLQIWHCLYRS